MEDEQLKIGLFLLNESAQLDRDELKELVELYESENYYWSEAIGGAQVSVIPRIIL